MCVNMRVCIHACVYMHQTHRHACAYEYACVCMQASVRLCAYAYVSMHVTVQVCMYIHMCVNISLQWLLNWNTEHLGSIC